MAKGKTATRKQIGATLDADLYRQMRAQAMLEDRTVGELIDDSMKMYLAKTKPKMRRTR